MKEEFLISQSAIDVLKGKSGNRVRRPIRDGAGETASAKNLVKDDVIAVPSRRFTMRGVFQMPEKKIRSRAKDYRSCTDGIGPGGTFKRRAFRRRILCQFSTAEG